MKSETRLTAREIAEVEALIAASTREAVAKRLRVSPQTLKTMILGGEGHRGTLILIRDGLAAARVEKAS